jgi:acyl-CoA reductase-like NAD-dependent aldehyde dehydrogenase
MYSSKPPPTIISNASKTRIEKLVSEAVSSGASVIYRGKNDAPGSRLGPIVVGDMRESMKMWQDEVFGNAVGCMTFNTDDEAIEIANRGGYGLSGAIFTKDLRRALALAKRIESG